MKSRTLMMESAEQMPRLTQTVLVVVVVVSLRCCCEVRRHAGIMQDGTAGMCRAGLPTGQRREENGQDTEENVGRAHRGRVASKNASK